MSPRLMISRPVEASAAVLSTLTEPVHADCDAGWTAIHLDTRGDTICRVGRMGSEIDEELPDTLLAGLTEFRRRRPRPA